MFYVKDDIYYAARLDLRVPDFKWSSHRHEAIPFQRRDAAEHYARLMRLDRPCGIGGTAAVVEEEP